jgi:hypothetical protein
MVPQRSRAGSREPGGVPTGTSRRETVTVGLCHRSKSVGGGNAGQRRPALAHLCGIKKRPGDDTGGEFNARDRPRMRIGLAATAYHDWAPVAGSAGRHARCPDRNGALACIKPARAGGVVASGPSASMGPEPRPTGGSFSFCRHGRYKHSGRTTLRCNCSCLLPLGASARAERQPPSPDTPPLGSNMSKDRSLEPPPARGSSFFK